MSLSNSIQSFQGWGEYFSCNVFIEQCQIHAFNSLEALSFYVFSTEIEMKIEALLSFDLTPSQACNEFLRNLQSNSDELNFNLEKADQFKLYIKYCHVKTGGRNGSKMFDKLEERINEFMESNEGAKSSYQLYCKDHNSALFLAIMTQRMQRLHAKVIVKLIFHKNLRKI